MSLFTLHFERVGKTIWGLTTKDITSEKMHSHNDICGQHVSSKYTIFVKWGLYGAVELVEYIHFLKFNLSSSCKETQLVCKCDECDH